MAPESDFRYALDLAELTANQPKAVRIEGHSIALVLHEGEVFAVDNRCPHMGFPLDRGSVECGILTCHWHHARFELRTGGSFDPFADDVRSFPVRIQDGQVLVDISPPPGDPMPGRRARLQEGLDQNLRLVIAKSVIGLSERDSEVREAIAIGASFACRHTRNGWGQGLTILTAMANLLPSLDSLDRGRALYIGLTFVAREAAGQAPNFPQPPLRGPASPERLREWFRQFAQVRDREGCERVLATAVAIGLPPAEVAGMLFAATTDHLHLDGGHTLDFCNKAFELLDHIGWKHAAQVLPTLVPRIAGGRRSEESSSWRRPVDIAQLLWDAFAKLPEAVASRTSGSFAAEEWDQLSQALLGDDPGQTVNRLTDAVRKGADFAELGSAVAGAAARRIAQFPVSNEFTDWDTALHTFTYANAVHQALRRAPSEELLRGVFDAAMSVYLDRFLNLPSHPVPRRGATPPKEIGDLQALLDARYQVNEAGSLIAGALGIATDVRIRGSIGKALVREDGDFHTLQMVEAAFRQHDGCRDQEQGDVALIAAARYLAAHAPTPRMMEQTYRIAERLHRGDRLFEE